MTPRASSDLVIAKGRVVAVRQSPDENGPRREAWAAQWRLRQCRTRRYRYELRGYGLLCQGLGGAPQKTVPRRKENLSLTGRTSIALEGGGGTQNTRFADSLC